MSGSFDEKDLQNLDKQTLITMLMMSSSSARSLQATVDQLNKNIHLLTEEVASLRQERFGRKSEKSLSGSDGQSVLIFNEAEVMVDLYIMNFPRRSFCKSFRTGSEPGYRMKSISGWN